VLTELLQLFLPQIVFYGLAAVTSGLLNANNRFAVPMYTPVLNNLAVTIVFLTYAAVYEGTPFDKIGTSQILLMGLGTTLGVVLMAVAQIPAMRGLGRYSLTMSLRHPSVKRLAALSIFVIGYVIVNQLGYLTVQFLANKQTGGFTAYTYGYIFFQLPHGLFAVSIITALLPGMSSHAVSERWLAYREQLSVGIRSTIMLILPAAIGYFVLAEPIVRLLLKHGAATESSTDLVASVLRVFAIGLVPFSIFQLLLRAYYALRDTKTPFQINLVSTAVNVLINFATFAAFQVQGLAAGFAASYFIATGAAIYLLRKRIGGIDGKRIAVSTLRIAFASAGMGAVVFFIAQLMGAYDPDAGVIANLVQVVVAVGAGVASYVGLCYLFRVPELDFVTGILSRRLGERNAQHPPGSDR
jgi:putative peptidoglycan lipid II flippase